MTDIETTGPSGTEGDRTQWLTAPPPPPPDDESAAAPPASAGAEGEHGLATHSPLAGKRRHLSTAHVRAESPWMLASGGVIVALASYWVASFVAAFQHGHHITAQDRALRVFAPGTLVWVLGAVLAVALYSAGRRFQVPPVPGGPLRAALAMGLVLAGAAAVASAAISLVVELTNFGHGIATGLAGLIGYAGTLVLAGALAYWANHEHAASSEAHH